MSRTLGLVCLRFFPSLFAWAWTLLVAGGSGACSLPRDGVGLFLHMTLTAVYIANMAIGPKDVITNANEINPIYASVWGRWPPLALGCWFLYGFSFLYFMWTHTVFGFTTDTGCLYYDWVGFIGVAAMTVFGILHALGVTAALCFASRTRRPSFSIQSPLLYDGDQVLEVL